MYLHSLFQAILRLSRGKLLANVNQLSRQKLDKQFKNKIVDTIRKDIEAIKNERISLHIYDSIVQDQVLIQNDDHIPSSIRGGFNIENERERKKQISVSNSLILRETKTFL